MDTGTDPKEPPVSDRFRLMAEAIDHNAHAQFGGAVVIIPPPGGGDPIEILTLDIKPDVAQFWATIDTRIKIKLSELDEKRRNQNTFGMR